MSTQSATTEAAPAELEHLCPVHIIRLTHLLAGGAGHCARCGVYVQSLNHPMPTLDAAFIEKREAALAAERKTKRNAKAKLRRTATKQRGTVTSAAH